MSGSFRNLVFILVDQLRHDVPGYAGGMAKTPNIDKLAGGGVAYERAYTPLPVCGPARRALFSGRHPESFGAYGNEGFFPTPPFGPGDTLPQRLRNAGRRCGFVGKWDVSSTHGPQAFGFDFFAGIREYEQDIARRYPDLCFTGGWMGCESPLPLCDARSHYLARCAADFARDTPGDFFLWLDFGEPHLPCRPSKPFAGSVDPASVPMWPGYEDAFIGKPYCHKQQTVNWNLEEMPWRDMAPQVARYHEMVAQLDDAVGYLLSELEATGRLDDTLIVLTSDHGDMCGNHRMLDKHYVLYDDIVRVPLILAGSGIAPGGSAEPVSNCLDLPVTICDLLGTERLPDPHGQPLPGFGGGGREHITASGNGQQFGFFNSRMITDGRVKYVWNLTDTDELYDLISDPAELNNRIADPAMAACLAGLRRALHAELVAHGDQFAASGWLDAQLLEGRKI